MSMRAEFITNFHWHSLQAIEKYFKCILLLNRMKAKFGHDIKEGLNLVKKISIIHLLPETENFILATNSYARSRYLDHGNWLRAEMLQELDDSVNDIRRWCIKLTNIMIGTIVGECSILNGYLENILRENVKNFKYNNLIWCNTLMGQSPYIRGFSARNSTYSYTTHSYNDRLTFLQRLNEYIQIDLYKDHISALKQIIYREHINYLFLLLIIELSDDLNLEHLSILELKLKDSLKKNK